MYELEYYMYRDGYGPTNETLGKFIRELFGQDASRTTAADEHAKTLVIQHPTRPRP